MTTTEEKSETNLAESSEINQDAPNPNEPLPSSAPKRLRVLKKGKKKSTMRRLRKHISMKLNVFSGSNSRQLVQSHRLISNFNTKDGGFYFACIAPLKRSQIDVHCTKLSQIGDLTYCCGLFLKIDSSFTVHTILSTEFISALKAMTFQTIEYSNHRKAKARKSKQINSNSNSNISNINNNSNEEKYSDSESESEMTEDESVTKAFHPRDHWVFSKDMEHKHVIIFMHGQNYAPNSSANAGAEFVMNECISFYCGLPYLLVPFIWPSEGTLFDYDVESIVADNYCANELASFAARIWTLFERIDFVAHGKGCSILMQALQLLMTTKKATIEQSTVVCIAPDVPATIFNQYVFNLKATVRSLHVYVNTWDWKLFSSKWWNWTEDRAGAMLDVLTCEISADKDDEKEKESEGDVVTRKQRVRSSNNVFIVDTTELLSTWFGSNHYYLTNEFVKRDIIQLLSIPGGLTPERRNYVLPMASKNVVYTNVYRLVDKPYSKTTVIQANKVYGNAEPGDLNLKAPIHSDNSNTRMGGSGLLLEVEEEENGYQKIKVVSNNDDVVIEMELDEEKQDNQSVENGAPDERFEHMIQNLQQEVELQERPVNST